MRASTWRVIVSSAAVVALAVGATGCSSSSKTVTSSARKTSAHADGTRHFAFNSDADQSLALSLGFDVMDVTGSGSHPRRTKAIVDSLPRGVQALIWVGNMDNTNCDAPDYTTAEFRALVDAMARDRKVYGYYIADEPHPLTCRDAVADIRARAEYLHAHSRFEKAFIVIQDGVGPCGSTLGCEFAALQPSKSGVDLIGVDPYPCHYGAGGEFVPCDDGLIRDRVAAAIANGIPASVIVPLFQTFGQAGRVGGDVYYRMPTPSELNAILATWDRLVAHPVLDAAYTFGVECSTTCPAPQALVNHPELQAAVRAHNARNSS